MTDIPNKIYTNVPRPQTETDAPKKSAVKKGDTGFEKILSEQIQPNGLSENKSISPPLPEIQATFRAGQIQQSFSSLDQIETKMAESINLFEQYSMLLGNPEADLKQAHDILETVLRQTLSLETNLNQSTDQATEKTKALEDILSQLLTTISVEQVKWDRGDYFI